MEKTMQNFANFIKTNHGEKIAYKYLIDENIIEKSYLELSNDINSIKSFLLENYGERNKIAIISESSYHWISLCLGIYGSNNILVSVDYNLSPIEITDILTYTETKAVFITKTQLTKLNKELEKTNIKIYIIEEQIEKIYNVNKDIKCNINNEDLAQILFTSGTTNKMKGVMLSYKNIESAIFCDLDFEDSLMLSLLPMYHCFELFCGNLYRLYRGCTICLNDNINNLMKNMQLFKPKYITIVPAMAKKFSDLIDQLGFDTFDKMTGGQLRSISCGGASIDKKIIENLAKYNVMIYQGYGLTETASCCLTTNKFQNKMGSVGIGISKDIKVKIAEDNELLIKSPSVMIGYFNNKEATSEAIKDGWFYSGDLAEIDEHGNVTILGRKLNKIVLSNGKNIYPEELESKFVGIPNIINTLIYENNDKINLLIQVEQDDSNKIDLIKSLVANINETLPGYKKISKIDFTKKQFPITTTNKIKRQVLINNLNDYIKNKITKEEIYKKVKNILQIEEDFSFTDNIYDLGFDSICTMELACILNINPQDIYLNPTINDIYKIITKEKNIIKEENDINKYIAINKNIKKPFKEKIVLLTGATGFLGSHILNEIADEYDEIYCLVRNKDKLKSIFYQYFKEELPGNINIVIGDIEKEMFGLSEDEYFSYTRKINSVIHCAANVNHIANYEKMYKTNVIGTKNVIRFAKQSNSIMHHMSTYSVSGYGLCSQTKDSIFNENILNIGQQYNDNIYVKTKYEAECEILKERYEGLLVNIYRIGSLSWRNDGIFQINSKESGLVKRINGLIKSNTVIDNFETIRMDFTPVDECANAISNLLKDNKVNNIYHLYNPNLISLKDFVNENTNVVSKENMLEKISETNDEDIKIYYYYNTIMNNNFEIILDSTKTIKKLNKLGFKWSVLKKDYIFKFPKN